MANLMLGEDADSLFLRVQSCIKYKHGINYLVTPSNKYSKRERLTEVIWLCVVSAVVPFCSVNALVISSV